MFLTCARAVVSPTDARVHAAGSPLCSNVIHLNGIHAVSSPRRHCAQTSRRVASRVGFFASPQRYLQNISNPSWSFPTKTFWLKSEDSESESSPSSTSSLLNLSSLPAQFYRWAFIPKVKPAEEDLPALDKFGGASCIGSDWPCCPVCGESVPLSLIVQVIPPGEDDFVQVFACTSTEATHDKDDGIFVRRVPRSDSNTCDMPSNSSVTKYPPYDIVELEGRKELVNFESIETGLRLQMDEDDDLFDAYLESPLCPSNATKLFGTATFRQTPQYDDGYIQLAESEFCPFQWGDDGIAHVSRSLDTDWDCF